jgi:hypothetical protein
VLVRPGYFVVPNSSFNIPKQNLLVYTAVRAPPRRLANCLSASNPTALVEQTQIVAANCNEQPITRAFKMRLLPGQDGMNALTFFLLLVLLRVVTIVWQIKNPQNSKPIAVLPLALRTTPEPIIPKPILRPPPVSQDPPVVLPPRSAARTGRTLGMCITGQQVRLELKSKIERLIKPMLDEFDAVDVVFVLSNDTVAKYSNFQFLGSKTKGHYSTKQEIEHELDGTVRHVRFVNVVQPDKPVLVPEYLERLDNEFQGEALKERGRAHVRQWSMYRDCEHALLELEIDNKERYTAMARVREDLYFIEKVNVTRLLKRMGDRKHGIVASSCDAWGGANDKAGFFYRDTAHIYFSKPLQVYYLSIGKTLAQHDKLRNPESFLRYAWEDAGAKVLKINPMYLDFLPERLQADGSSCLKVKTDKTFRCIIKGRGKEYVKMLSDRKCKE